MLVGRIIFGLGNGSLTIVQNKITAFWFKGIVGLGLALAHFACTARPRAFSFLFRLPPHTRRDCAPRLSECLRLSLAECCDLLLLFSLFVLTRACFDSGLSYSGLFPPGGGRGCAGHELALAFGFTMSLSRAGSVLNFNLSPAFADKCGNFDMH